MKSVLISIACLILFACSSGGLSKNEKGTSNGEAIEDSLYAHKDDFRSCYENEFLAHGVEKKYGIVRAKFTIEKDGKVRNAMLTNSTLGMPVVEACILGTLQKIEFQPPHGGIAVVTYPFKFSQSH
jgi:TonB family protein